MNYTRHNGCIAESETSPNHRAGSTHRRSAPSYTTDTPIQPVSVFLVDDHEMVRRGLIHVLNSDPDIQVIGEAGSMTEALNKIRLVTPDIVLLDIQLPDGSGIELCQKLRSVKPDLKCVILTGVKSDQTTLDAIQAGASGYLVKDIRASTLAQDIKEVAAGGSLIDPNAVAELTEKLHSAALRADPFSGLSNQEKTVLDYLGQGLTNKEIALHMGLAEKTVKNYVSRLFVKLGMERRIQAAVLVSNHKQATGPSAAT